MQTDLSYGVQQEQHDTHASWLPRACLFRIFTSHWDNCDFPDILILSHCVGGLKVPSPSDMRTCYANALCYPVYRLSCVTLSRCQVPRLHAVLHNTFNIYDSFIHHHFEPFTTQEDLRHALSYYKMQTFHIQADDKNVEYNGRTEHLCQRNISND